MQNDKDTKKKRQFGTTCLSWVALRVAGLAGQEIHILEDACIYFQLQKTGPPGAAAARAAPLLGGSPYYPKPSRREAREEVLHGWLFEGREPHSRAH